MKRISFTPLQVNVNHEETEEQQLSPVFPSQSYDRKSTECHEKTKHDSIQEDEVMQEFTDSELFEKEIMSQLDEKYSFPEKPSFVGFASAKGTKLKISNTALAKAKAMMDEKELPKIDDETAPESGKFPSSSKYVVDAKNNETKMAINKDESLKHTGAIPKSSGFKAPRFAKELRNLPLCSTSKDVKINESTRGNGNKLELSEDALAKAKNLFNEDFPDENNQQNSNSSHEPSFRGFSTAKGSHFKPSEDALNKAKSLFGDDLRENTETETSNQSSGSHVPQNFAGFQTAKGSKLDISEEALNKVKNMFAEDDLQKMPKEKQIEKIEKSEVNEPKKSDEFQGFSSAKGTKLQISDEALAKASNIFKETETELQNKIDEPMHIKEFQGFSTAKGTKFQISEEALHKAKSIFKESNTESEALVKASGIFKESETKLGSKIDETVQIKEFQGFLTAKGTKFQISDEALHKARNIFNENDAESEDQIEEASASSISSQPMKFKGFSTGSGSKMQISDEALQKAKSLFDEGSKIKNIDEFKENIDENVKKRKFNDSGDAQEELSKKACLSETKSDTDEVMEDAFNDDFEVNTQVLRDVERLAFQSPFKTNCKLIGVPNVDSKTLEQRRQLRLKQKEVIFTGKIFQGSLTLSKKKKNMNLKNLSNELNDEEDVAKSHEILDSTLEMTSELAKDHVFIGRKYFKEEILTSQPYVELGDSAKVIFNDAGNIDFEAIFDAFRSSPGVNPSKIDENWVRNHYRWIVWKLASYERRFPGLNQSFLHPHQVLLQLRYRYDLEIEGQSRSALRRIYEKDDVPSKCLLLVIAEMIKTNDYIFMELSDGWYSIGCKVTDESFNKLKPGMKIVTFGAELVNHDQPCSPLEAPAPETEDKGSPILKMHFNSTRRARWHSKLGKAVSNTVLAILLFYIR